MLVEVSAAVALVTTSPAAPGAAPIREVVYKVSYTRREDLSIEHYGGMVTTPSGRIINGSAPSTNSTTTGDKGTITVDVMAVTQDALGIRVIERWEGRNYPLTFLGNVSAAGIVNFDPQISETTRHLLPFFGTLFTQNRSLDSGAAWSTNFNGNAVDVNTTFTVAKLDGPIVQLDETQQINMKSVHGMDTVVTGKIAYKPSLLVPISGNIVSRAARTTASSVDEITTVLNFERISDSRDSP